MEISDKILELAEEYHNGEGMPRGDYQGAIEAQIMNAIRFGREQGEGAKTTTAPTPKTL